MTYHVHQINSNLHKGFLAEQRRDPVTKEFIKAGDKVVICAACRGAFLEDSWQYLNKEHCEQLNTLSTIQSAPSNQRFSSARARRNNSRTTNTSTNARSTRTPDAPPNIVRNLAAAILGGAFVVFLGVIFISAIVFLAVRFVQSGNNPSVVSSNTSANNSTKRVYSNNSTVSRNNSVYTNTNKVSNAYSPTPSPSTSPSSCYLYNDKSYETKIFIRSDCDIYDCDMDPSRIVDSLPDNTPIKIIKGILRINSNVKNYSWIKVKIIDTGQLVWVADSKIKCD